MKTLLLLPALTTLLLSATISANTTQYSQGRVLTSAADYQVLSPRQRVAVVNRLTNHRLEQLLPQLMAEAGIDMWLVINREYAEDPVYFTLVPQPSFAARRTTMLLFNRRADGTVEKLSVNRYPLGAPYDSGWAGGNLAEQWQTLAGYYNRRV
jgi:hypothetical protein